MADAGTRRIAKLLDGDSARLAKATQKMVVGLVRRSRDETPPPRGKAFDGLREVDAFYRGLQSRIEKVDTRSTSAKKAVIEALKKYRIALAEFGGGLKGDLVDPVAQLERAEKLASQAARDLKTARDRL